MSKLGKQEREIKRKIENTIDNTITNYENTQKQLDVVTDSVNEDNLIQDNRNRFKSIINLKNNIKENYKK